VICCPRRFGSDPTSGGTEYVAFGEASDHLQTEPTRLRTIGLSALNSGLRKGDWISDLLAIRITNSSARLMPTFTRRSQSWIDQLVLLAFTVSKMTSFACAPCWL
jgi:hypothetical protein